jgi:hypothetical protein
MTGGTDNVFLFFLIYIILYAAKAICIFFFVIQAVKYHIFTKNEQRQDKFIRRSLKIMSVAYTAAFVDYTYELVLVVDSM